MPAGRPDGATGTRPRGKRIPRSRIRRPGSKESTGQATATRTGPAPMGQPARIDGKTGERPTNTDRAVGPASVNRAPVGRVAAPGRPAAGRRPARSGEDPQRVPDQTIGHLRPPDTIDHHAPGAEDPATPPDPPGMASPPPRTDRHRSNPQGCILPAFGPPVEADQNTTPPRTTQAFARRPTHPPPGQGLAPRRGGA